MFASLYIFKTLRKDGYDMVFMFFQATTLAKKLKKKSIYKCGR